jgi:transcription termination/antitermination protein NusG
MADDQNIKTEDTNLDEESPTSNLPVEEAGQLEAPEDQSISEPNQSEPDKIGSEISEDQKTSKSEQAEKSEDEPEELPKIDAASETQEETAEEKTDNSTTEPPAQDTPGRWYVVHTYSGHENKVATTLKQRVESEHLTGKIFEVLVPMQDKIEIRGGKKASIKEKIFPGYILVKMLLDDQSWLAVRTTQGVTSFVGMGNKPTPISEKEVQTIIRFTQITEPTFKQIFSVNDTVKIVDGPFAEFIGKVDSVDEEKGKVRVLVSIFGRETPVELDFLQVQKI